MNTSYFKSKEIIDEGLERLIDQRKGLVYNQEPKTSSDSQSED